jgi:hypothetical protein
MCRSSITRKLQKLSEQCRSVALPTVRPSLILPTSSIFPPRMTVSSPTLSPSHPLISLLFHAPPLRSHHSSPFPSHPSFSTSSPLPAFQVPSSPLPFPCPLSFPFLPDVREGRLWLYPQPSLFRSWRTSFPQVETSFPDIFRDNQSALNGRI